MSCPSYTLPIQFDYGPAGTPIQREIRIFLTSLLSIARSAAELNQVHDAAPTAVRLRHRNPLWPHAEHKIQVGYRRKEPTAKSHVLHFLAENWLPREGLSGRSSPVP